MNALVVSGGGSKGAFAVGALTHMLLDQGLSFDILAGTSTGSLIVPLIVTNEIAKLRSLYTTLRQPNVILERGVINSFLNFPSVFDTTPFEGLLRTVYINERMQDGRKRADVILTSSMHTYITAVNFHSGEVEYFHAGKNPSPVIPNKIVHHIPDEDTFIRSIRASADQPGLMPPVDVLQNGTKYLDGGCREIAPIQVTIDAGATEIFAIVLSPKTTTPQNTQANPYNSLIDVLKRLVTIFTREISKNDIEVPEIYANATNYIVALKKKVQSRFNLTDIDRDQLFSIPNLSDPFNGRTEITLHIIRPESEHDIVDDDLKFKPTDMARMMTRGEQVAKNYFQNLNPIKFFV